VESTGKSYHYINPAVKERETECIEVGAAPRAALVLSFG
jgi:hypothetical protein